MKQSINGPDFICIGAQRSGTTWLHKTLSQHPQLWLTPVKEIHYFNGKAEEKRARQTPINRHSSDFHSWVTTYYSTAPADDAWYASLFTEAQAHGLHTGESTPAYATLDDDALSSLYHLCSDVKLIFIMRDPVERAWSAAINDWIKKNNDREFNTEEMLNRELKPALFARSTYIDTIERFERFFPKERIHYAFYEDLVTDPVHYIHAILSFLEVDETVASSIITEPTRSTSKQMPMPDVFKHRYAHAVLPSIERLCERFDGPPHVWHHTYKKLLNDITKKHAYEHTNTNHLHPLEMER